MQPDPRPIHRVHGSHLPYPSRVFLLAGTNMYKQCHGNWRGLPTTRWGLPGPVGHRLPILSREVATWNATNPMMEESAAYSSNPSPKSHHRKSSSRFKPGGSNSTNRVVPLSYHDQPVTSTSNGLNADDLYSNSGFRRGVSPLSTRSLVM